MRDPRPGLRWSQARVRRRARYGTYMDSPEWFRRRERWVGQYREAHEGEEPVCVVCGAPWKLRDGDLHHRSYARLGEEAWQDLIAMCRDHHTTLHVVMEKNPAWRTVPREQATDLIVAYLRAKVTAERGVR